MPAFETDKAICLSADKSAVVDCDSEQAAYQLAGAGGMVSAEDAEKYHLRAPEPKAMDAPPADKVVRGPGGKK